jgi:hypothetical protein
MIFDQDNEQNEAKRWANFWLFLKVVLPIVGSLFLIVAIYEAINRSDDRSNNKLDRKLASAIDSPTHSPTPKLSPTPTPTPVFDWHYETREYAMSNRDIKKAFIMSTNSFIFDFPYGGSQRALLILRKHPRWGRDVILGIEKGQFICRSYNNCRVLVRFDKGKARYYRATEPADNSSNKIFIRGYNRFVSRLKRAKRLYIEATFYNEGVRVLEFDVEGLKF